MRAFVVVAALLVGACSSPEAGRQRAGGPGADVGNHGDPIEMHGKQDMFAGTRVKTAAAGK
jgi:hypothetical protein